jgi:hypothetical protein
MKNKTTMTLDERQAAWRLVNKFGPSNSWTASNGTLAAALGRALKKIEELEDELNLNERGDVIARQDAQEATSRPGSEILLEAHRLVNQDRGQQYGPPHEDYAKVAEIFKAMTGVDLSVKQAIMFPLAMKLARIRTNTFSGHNGWHRDSVVDACGYLSCLAMAHAALSQPVE